MSPTDSPVPDRPCADPRFARTELLLGWNGMERLRQAHVLVVGLGAVGSYAVEGLARAGVGRLRIADFDILRPSNMNRQLYALDSTLGRAKTDVAEARIHDIHPNCRVEVHRVFADAATLPALLEGPPDVVIDAIDSVSSKILLLAAAVRSGAFVVSSMGAATRTDPLQIRTGDLKNTNACPLARRVRKRLRLQGISEGIRCVYSLEPANTAGRSGPRDWSEEDLMQRGRPRAPLGSLSVLTGMFGLIAASEAIRYLTRDTPPNGAAEQD